MDNWDIIKVVEKREGEKIYSWQAKFNAHFCAFEMDLFKVCQCSESHL